MRLPIHADQSGGTDEGSRIVHGVPNPLSKTGNHMHPPGGRELQEASGRRPSRDVFAQGRIELEIADTHATFEILSEIKTGRKRAPCPSRSSTLTNLCYFAASCR